MPARPRLRKGFVAICLPKVSHRALNLGRRTLLPCFEIALGRSHCLLDRNCAGTRCQAFGPIKLFLRPAKLAAPPFSQR